MLFMDTDGDWKGTAVSDGHDGYNLFRNNNAWWGYLRPTGKGGVNVFASPDGAWIGYGVVVNASKTPDE